MKTSRIFGEYEDPTKEEENTMEQLIAKCPVAAFGMVNKLLNSIGLCVFVDKLPEKQHRS